MLICKGKLPSFIDTMFNCGECVRCFPKSNFNYPFRNDLKNSLLLVDKLKEEVKKKLSLECIDTEHQKNPDLIVTDVKVDGLLICRVEAKYLQGKAFVKSSKIIGLSPKETLVVDEPKLLHYFKCKEEDQKKYKRKIPLFVVWMFDRPCDDIGGITVFQEIDVLKDIYNDNPSRCYTRETAHNDFVAGVKKGVTAKYHFSIKETRPIEEIFAEIAKAAEVSAKAILHSVSYPNHLSTFKCTDCYEIFIPKFVGAKLCIKCWKKSRQ